MSKILPCSLRGAITFSLACAAAFSVHGAPPTGGSKPAISVSGFELPTNAAASFPLIEKALAGAKLSVGGAGTSERAGDNSHVTVVVTCAQLSSGQSRVEVASASTDAATADFYRNDIKVRLLSKDPSATPPGESVPTPTTGSAPVAQFGGFEETSQHLDAADKAMTAEGLKIAITASGQHTGENNQVAVVVTCAILKPQTPPPTPDANGNKGLDLPDEVDRFVVIAFSTSSPTAEYYRNSIRNIINPPVTPPVIR